jgi:hypothetical protein
MFLQITLILCITQLCEAVGIQQVEIGHSQCTFSYGQGVSPSQIAFYNCSSSTMSSTIWSYCLYSCCG